MRHAGSRRVAHSGVSLEPSLVLPADLAGEELIDAMRRSPAGEYLLVERGGELYGVLATSDVNRTFSGV